MAELTIRLEVDPKTGKKNVIIGYRADEDALPIEHEEDHRRLVDQLIEGGALKAGELGEIIIDREEGHEAAAEAEQKQGESAREALESDS